jgi:hypothetical protein
VLDRHRNEPLAVVLGVLAQGDYGD